MMQFKTVCHDVLSKLIPSKPHPSRRGDHKNHMMASVFREKDSGAADQIFTGSHKTIFFTSAEKTLDAMR